MAASAIAIRMSFEPQGLEASSLHNYRLTSDNARRVPLWFNDLRGSHAEKRDDLERGITDVYQLSSEPRRTSGALAEQLLDLRRIFAPRFGEIRTSAAPAADDGRELFDDAARLDTSGEVLGDRDDEADLAVVVRGEHDHAAPEPIAQRVGDAAQPGLVEPGDALGQELDAVRRPWSRRPRACRPRCRRRAQSSSSVARPRAPGACDRPAASGRRRPPGPPKSC